MYIKKRKDVLCFHYPMRAWFGFSIRVFMASCNVLGNVCSLLLLMKNWYQFSFIYWVECSNTIICGLHLTVGNFKMTNLFVRHLFRYSAFLKKLFTQRVDLSDQEAEAGGSIRVWGQLGLHRKWTPDSQSCICYIVRLGIKKKILSFV